MTREDINAKIADLDHQVRDIANGGKCKGCRQAKIAELTKQIVELQNRLRSLDTMAYKLERNRKVRAWLLEHTNDIADKCNDAVICRLISNVHGCDLQVAIASLRSEDINKYFDK